MVGLCKARCPSIVNLRASAFVLLLALAAAPLQSKADPCIIPESLGGVGVAPSLDVIIIPPPLIPGSAPPPVNPDIAWEIAIETYLNIDPQDRRVPIDDDSILGEGQQYCNTILGPMPPTWSNNAWWNNAPAGKTASLGFSTLFSSNFSDQAASSN
jgi:hypothetical protein